MAILSHSTLFMDDSLSAGLVVNAAGLAILTVAKLGFLVTARGGSGIVIAKLRGGCK